MFNIEYEIDLNEFGRPYIKLPDDYEQRSEDRFFALEITRYILQDLLKRNDDRLDNNTTQLMIDSERLLGQLGDEVAHILHDNMKGVGDMIMFMNVPYHISVNSIEKRDALPYKDILFNDKIFDRIEELKVQVLTYNLFNFEPAYEIYELINGINNENWVKL
jgi:hypothetical protein